MSDNGGYADDFEDDFDETSRSESAASAYRTKGKRPLKSRAGSKTPRQKSGTDTRLWSANHRRTDELQNKLTDLTRKLKEAKEEIKLLNKVQRRQDKELNRFTGSDAELPRTLMRRTEELRTTEAQLRTVKGKLGDANAELKKKDKAVLKLTDQNKKLKVLTDQKGLKDRAVLETEVEELKKTLSEKTFQLDRLQVLVDAQQKRDRRAKKADGTHATGEVLKLKEQVVELRKRNKGLQKELDDRTLTLAAPKTPVPRLKTPTGLSPASWQKSEIPDLDLSASSNSRAPAIAVSPSHTTNLQSPAPARSPSPSPTKDIGPSAEELAAEAAARAQAEEVAAAEASRLEAEAAEARGLAAAQAAKEAAARERLQAEEEAAAARLKAAEEKAAAKRAEEEAIKKAEQAKNDAEARAKKDALLAKLAAMDKGGMPADDIPEIGGARQSEAFAPSGHAVKDTTPPWLRNNGSDAGQSSPAGMYGKVQQESYDAPSAVSSGRRDMPQADKPSFLSGGSSLRQQQGAEKPSFLSGRSKREPEKPSFLSGGGDGGRAGSGRRAAGPESDGPGFGNDGGGRGGGSSVASDMTPPWLKSGSNTQNTRHGANATPATVGSGRYDMPQTDKPSFLSGGSSLRQQQGAEKPSFLSGGSKREPEKPSFLSGGGDGGRAGSGRRAAGPESDGPGFGNDGGGGGGGDGGFLPSINQKKAAPPPGFGGPGRRGKGRRGMGGPSPGAASLGGFGGPGRKRGARPNLPWANSNAAGSGDVEEIAI